MVVVVVVVVVMVPRTVGAMAMPVIVTLTTATHTHINQSINQQTNKQQCVPFVFDAQCATHDVEPVQIIKHSKGIVHIVISTTHTHIFNQSCFSDETAYLTNAMPRKAPVVS